MSCKMCEIMCKRIVFMANHDAILKTRGVPGNTLISAATHTRTLRKLLRDGSVISKKLYSPSIFSSFLILYKYILPTIKYILIGSMFGKKLLLIPLELHDYIHY